MSESNGLAKRCYSSLRLDEAADATPPLSGLGAYAEKLRAAVYDGVSEADVKEIVARQVEKAKEGDSTAAKFVLGLTAGKTAAPKVQNVKIIERIRDVGASPGRVVETDAEPVKTMVIESPAARQMRKLVALYLIANNGSARLEELARNLELQPDQLEGILNCPWFIQKGGVWSITPAGRNANG